MIAPDCKVAGHESVCLPMDRPEEAALRPLESPESPPETGALVRHPTFSGHVIRAADEELSIESSRGLRIGARYELELIGELGACAIKVVVRWCRLCAVRPGTPEGDFVPLFRSGLQITSSLPGGTGSVA